MLLDISDNTMLADPLLQKCFAAERVGYLESCEFGVEWRLYELGYPELTAHTDIDDNSD